MPASPSTARAINDRLALRLLQSEGPLTAGQLKQLTGLSRPSVADLVERLRDSGLIAVVGEAGERRRGPNARLYGIVADRAQLAALDVRTESVTVVVADLLGAPLAEASLPMDDGTSTGPAVERAVALVERTAATAGATRLHTVGVGAPGLIDPATGDLRDSAGLPAWHRSLVAALTERLPARVLVENETNLAARAEQRDGAAHDRDTFVLLWLGAGTGAAVVLDGALRRGASGGTGEIGFLPVPGTGGLPSATACDGGFHTLAGSGAVADLAADHGLKAEPEPGELPAAALVRHAVETGHAAFLTALADRVAIGAASVAAVLDPGCVVLGGELGRAGGAALADRVARRVAAMSPLRTEVRASALGGAAVLRGALLTARDAAQDELFTTGA
ncbi:N-acetylglucosamine repressor [Streptomyces sp. YIM 121038]|uniref:ROK family transcriptional regulator n=1 Tax=Streptomyces sp. YIM 121038 TaxID=2136401 RepID=UPI001110F77F|nr:ROK family transcriptional regulator [Streptomyces sp. YIM 121038]QCX75217.1 N-acetylglucosamine repressor [Streptomyces sp. YIM 121038]